MSNSISKLLCALLSLTFFCSGLAFAGDRTWTSLGLPGAYIWALAIDPTAPKTIYAGTGGNAMFKTIDAGGTWTPINRRNGILEHVFALAIDPTAPQTIYAGTFWGPLFRSTNGGDTWTFCTTTGVGATAWALAIDPTAPQVVYAGTDGGVAKSTDWGINWIAATKHPVFTGINTIAIDPSNSQIIYAGTQWANHSGGRGGISKSTDGGSTWNLINTGLTNLAVSAVLVDPKSPQTLYIGTYDPEDGYTGGGVFKSTNGGNSWNPINTGLTTPDVRILAIDPTATQTLYAGTGQGVFKTTNGGSSWSPINTGLKMDIAALALDPSAPQTIYAGTHGAGVWVYSALPLTSTDMSLGVGSVADYSTAGSSQMTRSGYAKVATKTGADPYGTAVFSFRQNGVTVSEAGVPAAPPTTAARVFIDYRSSVAAIPGRASAGTINVNTGIAVVNNGSASAAITYTLRSTAGAALSSGHGILAAGAHFAKFIEQLKDMAPDFVLPPNFQTLTQFASLEITSNQPLSVLALRMTTNQRNEALFTTTPIADLTKPATNGVIFFPQFADGGGYTTSVVLLNTSSGIESGTLQFFDDNGSPLVVNQVGGIAGSIFRYSIPNGGVARFQTDGFPAATKAGWAELTPDVGTSTPVGAGVFSYNPGDFLVTESGIPAVVSTTHARVYVDLSAGHNTGLAIANPASTANAVTITAFQRDGATRIGTTRGPLQLPANGHSARFASELVAGLPTGFTGVLDIVSSAPFAALTMRSLNNERNDFLLATFPIADMTLAAPSPIVFPQIADGGGYTTQFILIGASGASSVTLSFYGEDGKPLLVGQ